MYFELQQIYQPHIQIYTLIIGVCNPSLIERVRIVSRFRSGTLVNLIMVRSSLGMWNAGGNASPLDADGEVLECMELAFQSVSLEHDPSSPRSSSLTGSLREHLLPECV
jgi:hypothetical protein